MSVTLSSFILISLLFFNLAFRQWCFPIWNTLTHSKCWIFVFVTFSHYSRWHVRCVQGQEKEPSQWSEISGKGVPCISLSSIFFIVPFSICFTCFTWLIHLLSSIGTGVLFVNYLVFWVAITVSTCLLDINAAQT